MTAPHPDLLVFDVNETLSDMSPLRQRFTEVGAPAGLTGTWFAGLLRDGFALTTTGDNPPFADLAAEGLRTAFHGLSLDRDVDAAVHHVMEGLPELGVHPDVVDGVRILAAQGLRLVTLSNGSASIAETLLEGAGVREHFEALLTVEDAALWKPAAASYEYALERCGVDAADAMLVAAHPWDTHGASRAGLNSAWVNRAGAPYPSYFAAPDVTVSSLADLAAQLA
ncbi:MAG TPA: haloacid dehalogenase type II [Nocardioides sp.]